MIALLLPSGRGARIEVLSPTKIDEVSAFAAASLSPSDTMIHLKSKEARAAVECMVVEVTVEKGLTELKEDTRWKAFVPSDYDKLFSAKDHNVLTSVYHREHNVSADEVSAIMGKAQKVAET